MADYTGKNNFMSSTLSPGLNLPVSAIPFGYIQSTCDRYPQILYVNDQLKAMLEITEQNQKLENLIGSNLYMLLPSSEWELLKLYMEKTLHTGQPVFFKHRIFKGNGTIALADVWLGSFINEHGKKNFSFVYISIANNGIQRREQDSILYKSLKGVFDILLELDFINDLARCIHNVANSKLLGLELPIEDVIQFCTKNCGDEFDETRIREILGKLKSGNLEEMENLDVCQLKFSFYDEYGNIETYVGIPIFINKFCLLICGLNLAKRLSDNSDCTKILLHNYDAFLNAYFTERVKAYWGMIFEKKAERWIRFVFATYRVLEFLDISNTRYSDYLETGIPEDLFLNLLEEKGVTGFQMLTDGEETVFIDQQRNESIKVQCKYLVNGYYELLATNHVACGCSDALIPQNGIYIRTFGFFDVFVNGTPVIFQNEKEKELLAVLVDRKGGTLTNTEAIGILWEDEPVDEKVKNRFRKLVHGLKITLLNYGIEGILNNHNGIRNIKTETVICDYYEFLAGNPKFVHDFHGQYMSNYSWSENTLGNLWKNYE